MRESSAGGGMPPRNMAIVVLCLVAVVGAISGVAVDRVAFRRPANASILADTGYPRISSILRSPTDEQRRAVRAQLAAELELSPSQAAAVDSVLDAHAPGFTALREDIRPRVEQLISAVRSDVELLLTPEQVVRYRRLLGSTVNGRSDGSGTPP